MTVIVAGCLAGVLAGIALGARRGKDYRLGISYGLLVAGVIWSASALYAGNRADGMAGIPQVVAGGVVLWFVVVPAGIASWVLERRRRPR